DDGEAQRRLTVVGPEAGGRVGHVGVGCLAHDPAPEPLEHLLRTREVLDRHDVPVADHHVGLTGEDGRHQGRDVGRRVLVVGVGVDDDVGAQLEGGVQPRLEGGGQALVVGQLDDVVDPVLPGHLDRAVGRAVVDDEPLDLVEAGDLPGQVGQRDRELVLLVEARDLDDELHGRPGRGQRRRHGARRHRYGPGVPKSTSYCAPPADPAFSRRRGRVPRPGPGAGTVESRLGRVGDCRVAPAATTAVHAAARPERGVGAISNSDRPAHLTAVRDDGPEGPASAPAHDRSAGERHARRSRLAGLRAVPGYVWWVTALYVTVLVGYSIVVPTYRAPDEPLHVDLSHLFSEELTYPAWDERDTGPDVQRSLSIVRFGDQAAHLEAGDAPPKSERPAFEDRASPPMPTGINQLPQHPPLYYVTTGLAMWAAEAVVGDPIGDFVLETWLYRAMSIAFVAVLPLAVWRVCELLGAARTVTVTAMLVPLAIPQLMHIGASANNDNLVLAFMWLSTPVVLRIARGALGTRTAVLAGVLTGLGLLPKLYASVPPIWVLGALLLAVRRARRANLGAAVRFAVVYGVVALVTGGWWWIRNIVLYGELTPSRFSELVPPTDRPRDLWAFLDAWAYSTTRRFWGDFGWYDTH